LSAAKSRLYGGMNSGMNGSMGMGGY